MQNLRRKCLLLSLGFLIVALPFVLFHVYTDTVGGKSIPYVISAVKPSQIHAARTGFPHEIPRLATTDSQAKQLVHVSGSFVKRYSGNGSFVSALTARADADRCIILTMTDIAFTDMAINFYEASLRAHHIDNFLFVGVGRKTCEILANLSIPCFYYADDPNSDTASSFGQEEFNHKVNIRNDMILEALTANFTVIHSDTDVAFLSNPLSALKVGLCLITYTIWLSH